MLPFRFLLVMALLLGTSVASSAASFEDLVKPFVAEHCLDCHDGDDAKAKLSFHNLTAEFSSDTRVDAWQNVLKQLTLGSMPPADQPQPDASQVHRVTTWIRSELMRIGQTPTVDHQLRSPGFGNFVNHERLFDGSQVGPSFSPPRLWRLSPYVYNQLVDNVGGNLRRETAIHQPFPLDAGKGVIADFAAQQFADAATLQLLMMNCQTIVEFQTDGVLHRNHRGETHRMKRTPQEFEDLVNGDAVATDEQVITAIRYEYDLVLERPPTEAELKQLVAFFRTAAKLGGKVRGLQTTLKAILMKPEAVYRMEIGLGPEDAFGRRRLSDEELAFAIARALSDKGPSDIRIPAGKGNPSLLEAARDGRLGTVKAIQQVVRQILDDQNMSTADYRMFQEDHKIGNTPVLRFFREFFGYHHAPKVFKDEKRIGFGDRYLTKRMVDDADQLVMHLFDEDEEVLRRLLTTDEYFVAYLGSAEHIKTDLHYIKTNVNDAGFEFNTKYIQTAEAAGRHPIPIEGPDSRRYVDFYNLDHETWDYPVKQPFKMPNGQRAGILMHPAWLIAWSGNFDNDPIRRGKWVREHLLADTIPDVPLDVNASVPESRDETLRDRLKVTREDYCWKCHQKMDPLGLPFECFDDFGRYREAEMLGDLLSIFPERHEAAKKVSVVTEGEVIDSRDGIDGPVADAFELVQKLADAKRVRQSFVRHAFRFWMGRNETLSDSTLR